MGGCFLHSQEIPPREKRLLIINRLKTPPNIQVVPLPLRSSGEKACKVSGEAVMNVEVR